MKEDVKKELDILIQKQKDRIPRLQDNGGLYHPYYYKDEDESKYIKWLTKTHRFLRTYFKNDEDVEAFKRASIIRKTKCSAILERSVHQQKTKRPHKNTNFTASNEE